jgi:hypothetical protein
MPYKFDPKLLLLTLLYIYNMLPLQYLPSVKETASISSSLNYID